MTETETGKPWRASVIRDFARSELFERTFQEGMDLVEETAAYLDGAGRQESKLLARGAALTYAAESMRLTTRLMQVASWLLVQRAVREGDMAPEAACDDRYRLSAQDAPSSRPEAIGELPPGLGGLLQRAEKLYDRVLRLDEQMYAAGGAEPGAANPVLSQFDRLRTAFGA